MSIKVFCVEIAERSRLEIVYSMAESHSWEPVYWTTSLKNEKEIKEKFPDSIVHESFCAIRGIPPLEYKDIELVSLDQPFLKEMLFCEAIALRMMDKMDPQNIFSFRERLNLYYFHLKYWLTVLKYHNPEIVVFNNVPHCIYDYILYALCQKRGIETRIFGFTSLSYLCVTTRNIYEESQASLLYKKLLKNEEYKFTLSTELEEDMEKIKKTEYSKVLSPSIKPIYSFIEDLRNPENSLLQMVYNFFNEVKSLVGSLRLPDKQTYFKQTGRRIDYGSYISNFKYQLSRGKAKRRKKMLLSYYNKFVVRPDFKKPYVYVSLHYQPELTTSPLGDFFVYQLLMIDMLSKVLPEGWHIYIKENILQFAPRFYGESSRSIEFYDDLRSLDNVSFVSLNTSPYELIDNASAVATIAGTTGFESIVRETPVLTFGHAWYNGCEGVFYVQTAKECKEVFEKIRKGYKVDYEKVKLFMHAVEKTSIRGFLYSKEKGNTNISYEENLQAFTDSLQNI